VIPSICRLYICILLLVIFATDLAHAKAPVDAANLATYPGMLMLKVDLTDAARKIFAVRETIPAR